MQLQDISARLIQSISVGICVVDAETGVVVSQNDTFATWFGAGSVEGQRLDIGLPVRPGDLSGLKPIELRTKVKRRTLVIEISAHIARHNGTRLVVVQGQNISRLRETEAMIDSYAEMVDRRTRELEREKTQVEKLLLNIMPRSVYEEYMTFGSVAPRLFEPVSVLMLDFVGFTQMAAAADPNVTVAELNEIFTAFDRISELHGCERIKTLGDCYMAVTGLPHPTPDHAVLAARAAVKMMRYLERRNQTHEHQWKARIGIASGSVVGSVVGVQKYIYDVFGPAVNKAARLQAESHPMEITICGSMRDSVMDAFDVGPGRNVHLRGFGQTNIAALTERKECRDVA